MALKHPLNRNEARKLLSRILTEGVTDLNCRHFVQEAAKDGLDASDALNAMRGGQILEEGEEQLSGCWRYRVHTTKICVVVEFVDENEVIAITVWRKKAS